MPPTAVSSGVFHVREGQVEAFLERWADLIAWTRDHHPSMGRASLSQCDSDPQRFTSHSHWTSAEARQAWRAEPGYRERSARCRELCDEYLAGDYSEVLAFGGDTEGDD